MDEKHAGIFISQKTDQGGFMQLKSRAERIPIVSASFSFPAAPKQTYDPFDKSIFSQLSRYPNASKNVASQRRLDMDAP
jgi:hypothetical protein